MAKFCGNCGAQWDDNVQVCGNCGNRLGGGTPGFDAGNGNGTNGTTNGVSSEKLAKILKFGSIGVAGILVIVILVSIFSNVFGYKGTVNKAMKAFAKYDISGIEKVFSKEIYGEYDEMVDMALESVVGYCHDKFANKLDGNFKVKYKITDSYKLEGRKEDTEKKLLESIYYGLDTDVYKKLMVVKVEATATYKKKTSKEKLQLILAKEKGKWVLVRLMADSGSYFDYD